jgi:hypothetical protein
MDLGNAGDKYHLADDTSTRTEENGSTIYSGLSQDQAKNVNQALLDSPTVDPNGLKGYLDHEIDKAQHGGPKVTVSGLINDYVKKQYEAAKDNGSPGVFVTVHSGTEQVDHHFGDEPIKHYHMMMVKDIDDQGNMTLLDAKGKEVHMTKDEFGNSAAMDQSDSYSAGGIGDDTSTATTSGVVGRRR